MREITLNTPVGTRLRCRVDHAMGNDGYDTKPASVGDAYTLDEWKGDGLHRMYRVHKGWYVCIGRDAFWEIVDADKS